MSLIRKHVAVLQAWACLDLVAYVFIAIFENLYFTGSATTQLMCGGIFNNHFITHFSRNMRVKKK